MKKSKLKLMIVVIFFVVFFVIGFYSFNNKDPYKKYNHIQVSEVLKENQHEYWVYFYSMNDQESMDSKNGIARLNKAVSNVYFVKIKDKEVVIENQNVKSATLLYIKDHQITKEYKGLKQLKDHSDEILQMSW